MFCFFKQVLTYLGKIYS